METSDGIRSWPTGKGEFSGKYTPRRNRIILYTLRWIAKVMIDWTGWTRAEIPPPADPRPGQVIRKYGETSGEDYWRGIKSCLDTLIELSGGDPRRKRRRKRPVFQWPVRWER